jgi:hypothetical protein
MNVKPTPSDRVKNAQRRGKARRLSGAKQRRLDVLMEKNNQGRVNEEERKELRALVREVEDLTLENARGFAEQRG